MAYVNLKCNVSVPTLTEETKTGLVFKVRIFAKDLTPSAHDVVGYEGLVYASEAAEAASAEPLRLTGLHQPLSNNPRGVKYGFGGQILSTDLTTYEAEIVSNKVELTAAAQTEVVGIIINNLAAALGVQASDFEVLP